jgi:hypothetical protein
MSNKYAGGIKAGSTSVPLPVELRSSTDGTALTGKTYSAVTAKYRRQGASSAVAITLSAGTLGTWSSGGFIEDNNGMYELGVPDAAFASGVDFVVITVACTGSLGKNFIIPLGQVDANLVQTLGTNSAGAAGYVGIDWAAIDNPTHSNALTGTTTNDLATALSDLSAVPGATATVLQALNLLYELARNKITQTGSTLTLFKDDSSTPVGSQSVSDDSTTFTRNKMT